LFISFTAQSANFKLADKSGIEFHIPYTAGTHDGEARISKAQLNLDFDRPGISMGEFIVPIEMMTTGNPERDCHMREALGLNYEQSDFPKEHACNDKHQLPNSGKNAVVFPEIIFKILSLRSLDPSGKILHDKETNIEVEGQWTIHGVSKKEKIPMKINSSGEKIVIHGETKFSLKDYNIVVKSGKVLFVTIGVKDTVRVNFDIQAETDQINTK
jgi:polyisoprenoid-binding protein YceI